MNRSGDECVKKAEKKLKGGGFFSKMFTSKKDRVEEAIELFKEAASHYKINGDFDKACECYQRCSSLHQGLGENREAADALEEAGAVLKEANPQKSLQFYKEAGDLFKASGDGASAAKNYKAVAQGYEDELEYDLAIENYREASRLFALEKYKSSDMHKCKIKVAELSSRDLTEVDQTKIIEAIKIFELIAVKYAKENMLRHSAKGYFFKSAILFLVIDDDVGMEKIMDKASEKDPYFNSAAEKKFLEKVLEAYRGNDLDAYSDVIMEWKERSTIDRWLTGVLAHIKRKIEGRSGAGGKKEGEAEESDDDQGHVDEDFDPY